LEAVVKSRASFKAHPLHPALIPFPFAFLTGSALFDVGFFTTGGEALSLTAAHLSLAGIAAGLLAAVPGIIDYVYTVPPESSAKARATRHGAGNVIALLLFGIAFWSRDEEWIATLITLGFDVAGAALMAYSGWLGGTLVTRNLISVDHRYADKGRWQEASFTARPGEEIAVAKAGDLKDGHMKLLHINGRRVALARTSSGFHAIDDGCTHRGGSLAGGVLIGDTVQCLWHGSQFDVKTGKALCGPADTGVETIAVRVDKGQVLVRIPK
jgi:nitrite reductase/ring-hydroxylating ferredoxin subunit/uncharacterized membrane protein